MVDRLACDSTNHFKINIFNVDTYSTKPIPRLQTNISSDVKKVTVYRVFGSTDNGIKICLHLHDYYPHFSVRMQDLLLMYNHKDDDQFDFAVLLDMFKLDLNKEIYKLFHCDDEEQSGDENVGSSFEEFIESMEVYCSR